MKTTSGLSEFIVERSVQIDYTNYRGERGFRRIYPLRLIYGSNEFHPEPQWMIEAFDVDRGIPRTFALEDIHEWNVK
jgi:predicted DNA-binding transcriptional regulator YafY